jgi:hypothetical protein
VFAPHDTIRAAKLAAKVAALDLGVDARVVHVPDGGEPGVADDGPPRRLHDALHGGVEGAPEPEECADVGHGGSDGSGV